MVGSKSRRKAQGGHYLAVSVTEHSKVCGGVGGAEGQNLVVEGSVVEHGVLWARI